MKSDIETLIAMPEFELKENREKLHLLLKKKCIKNCDDLIIDNNFTNSRWKVLSVDIKERQTKILNKFYIGKKRNDFYRIFSKSEWEIFFKKIYQLQMSEKSDNLTSFESIRDIYTLFPSKSDLTNMKINKNSFYEELRFLFYIGLPSEGRAIVWDKILDINKLVSITADKLLDEVFNKSENSKLEIFKYLKNSSQYNINFSLIDNDLNYLTPKSDTIAADVKIIRSIAKAFFLWGELNIMTDSIVKSSNLKENRKFVYFFGLLKIIQKLYSVIKCEIQTFWVIVGLSQILELFYQSNPLYTEELTYTQMYVLITKLVMEHHLKPLYHKFQELGFPIEFFIAKLIPTLYSDLFQTDLFLRLLDIIIFEASLKTNSLDRFDYLRVICTIPLTLLKMNEKKILECRSVTEMEVIFEDLNRKAFNNQKFLETLKENIEKFYEMNNFLERFVDINQSTSWDTKRARIFLKLSSHFSKVQMENELHLKKFSKDKISLGSNFIESYEDQIKNHLQDIRNVYSTGTPLKHSENTYGLYFLISNFYSYNNESQKPNKLYLWVDYNKEIVNIKDFNDRLDPTLIVKLDYVKIDPNLNTTNVCVKDSQVVSEQFSDDLSQYMNLFLKNENNYIIGQYALDIKKLDLMKPYKLKLESLGRSEKTVIEICLIKYSTVKVKDEVTDLFIYVFSEPNYLYDNKMENEINGVKIPSQEQVENLTKLVRSEYETYLNGFKHELKIEEKFIYEEFKKNFGISNNRKHNLEYTGTQQDMIETMFKDTHSVQDILEWIKTGESHFEEIIYAVILVDSSSITIYEKLKLIYDIAKSKNYLIYNEDKLQVSKLKEMVYSLYKRFRVYFVKSDVERLVDYILNGDKFSNFKCSAIYNNENSKSVDKIVNDRDHVTYSVVAMLKKDKKVLTCVKRQFIHLNNLLRNQFNLNCVPMNILNSVSASGYLLLENHFEMDDKINRFRVDLETDNVKKIKILNFEKISKNEIMLVYNSIKSNFRTKNESFNPFKTLLINEAESLEFSNNSNIEITFDKFKDVFFSLPFIPDLLRASCGFNYSSSAKDDEQFIKTFECVKIAISSSDNNSYIRNFLFTESFNLFKNSENEYEYDMANKISSSNSLRDVIEIIYSQIYNEIEDLKMYLSNPQMMTFLIFNKISGLEEKIKYFDPLYSNSFIRTATPATPIEIKIKLGTSDDITRVDQRLIMKKSGYAKFQISTISSDYEWRQCKIKEIPENQSYRFKFKSFNNNCKIVLI